MDGLQKITGALNKQVKRVPDILLVEDDETDVMFMRRCLAAHGSGARLIVAHDGSEALQMLRDGRSITRPFVIMTDLNMPGMSGHELLSELRADLALRNSVVFIISSSCLSGDIDQAYCHNVAGYISKQSPAPELRKCISMFFDYCDTVHLPSAAPHA